MTFGELLLLVVSLVLPFGLFSFCAFSFAVLKGLMCAHNVMSSRVYSGKGLPPAPLAMCRRSPSSLQAVTFRKLLEISLRSPYSSLPARALML